MRKSSRLRTGLLLLCVFGGTPIWTQNTARTDIPSDPTTQALSMIMVQRARNEVARIEALVAQGILPPARLDEAKVTLADVQDEAILAQTLYGDARIENMTAEQSKAIVEAAQRRVDRQSRIVEERRALLETGVLARSEFSSFQDELDSRERVLKLAQNRATLVEQLRQMAQRERELEHAQNGAVQQAMIRYEGNGNFNLNDLTTISNEFQKRFHHALPVSALGQTAVHQSMGLDHRNRVDVALNPDGTEGIWLLGLLERLRIPYLAFRSAVTGAATAPHIHIGLESTRLRLAQR